MSLADMWAFLFPLGSLGRHVLSWAFGGRGLSDARVGWVRGIFPGFFGKPRGRCDL